MIDTPRHAIRPFLTKVQGSQSATDAADQRGQGPACFCGLTVVGPRTGAKTDDDEDGEDEEDDEDGEDGEDGDDPPHGWTSHSMVAGGGQGSGCCCAAPSARCAKLRRAV